MQKKLVRIKRTRKLHERIVLFILTSSLYFNIRIQRHTVQIEIITLSRDEEFRINFIKISSFPGFAVITINANGMNEEFHVKILFIKVTSIMRLLINPLCKM